jgi:cell division protein FtsZ
MKSFVMSDELASFDQRALIKVCGVGGGGGNAIGRMIANGLRDVEFITINTDAQALKTSPAGTRLQIGLEVTGGLGSGAKPDVGHRAAMEDKERLTEVMQGADMVFITAGLGGGTGTGAAPIVAEVAHAAGALTVGIVTLPFSFEGPERMENAIQGLTTLEQHVDTLIVVPNDRVAALCNVGNISLLNAFHQADEVLHNGVRAISELITVPGLINLDFADVRTIMQARGRALMGIGRAEGDNRAVRAAEEAIVCPLLEQSSIQGAMGVIVNIKGGCDIGMREVQEAVTAVQKSAHPDANIIFGAVIDDEERPELEVTVIAAGFPKGCSESYIPKEYRAQVLQARQTPPSGPPQAAQAPPRKPAAPALDPKEAARAKAGAKEPEVGKPLVDDEMPLLFPDEGMIETSRNTVETEADEDISTPAYLRKFEADNDGGSKGIPSFMRRRKRT